MASAAGDPAAPLSACSWAIAIGHALFHRRHHCRALDAPLCLLLSASNSLVKVDRAAMAVGLETLAPFLDHRVAAVAWRLPLFQKIWGRTGKWALRQLLDRHVPRALVERPKIGFAMPIGQWLRDRLQPWANDLLHPDRLRRTGYLQAAAISCLWQQHLRGRHDLATKLWTVWMW